MGSIDGKIEKINKISHNFQNENIRLDKNFSYVQTGGSQSTFGRKKTKKLS